ncbi:MAG: hypothetical protein RLZZ536_1280 [Planctomycetota bacterium]
MARAVWQVRWLVAGCLIAGAVLGVWYESGQARYRTTATLRWMSPSVSYLHSGYWDIAGRTRASQLSALIGAHPQAKQVFLRTGKEPWIVRLEVLHEESGLGRSVCDEILKSLRALDEQTAANLKTAQGDRTSLQELRLALEQLEVLLDSVPEDKDLSVTRVSEDPITRLNQQFTGEVGLRVPVDNLPLFPWYRSLQVRAARFLAAMAADPSASAVAAQLTALQQQAVEKLVNYWWSLDLLASSAPLPEFNVEAVSEEPLGRSQRPIQSALVGMWIAGFAAMLLAVPLRWLRLNWRLIVRAESRSDA